MRLIRNRIKLTVTLAVVAAMFLTLLPAGPAVADHHGNTLEVDPESQSHPTGSEATLFAELSSPLTLMNPQVDFEIETGPGDTDGNTPKTPDMSCSVLIGLLGCSVSYISSKTGIDTVRAWIDLDNDDATNEYDNDEFPNEATGPGHPEADITDVVLVLWNQGATARLDCDDSNFNDTEQNFSTGPGSSETYTCKAADSGGIGMQGVIIDAENLSSTGVNDPELPNVDYNNICTTGGDGTCKATIPSQGKTGTADICFWTDTDGDDVYDPTASQGDPDFGEHDGGDCDGETVGEAENNDVTDVTQITWIVENVKPGSRIDRPANNGTYLDTALTRFEGIARDDHSSVVKVEIVLRKHRSDGTCLNWNGSAFVIGSCKLRRWVQATIRSYNSETRVTTWDYNLPANTRLSRSSESAGFYIMLSRATDSQGNIEDVFVGTNCVSARGCNRVRFEIRRA